MRGDLERNAAVRRGAPLAEAGFPAARYRDIVALGRGGMGDVHLSVRAGAADRVYVIKRLRSTLATDAEFLQKFLDEARDAARLHHPNIAETHEVGFDGQRYFIAREYLDGQPLSELLRRSSTTGGLPLAMQLKVLAEALAGLHHAHEQASASGGGLVHGDFSPSNIFVLYDGTVKVVDFGIAKTAYSGRTKADIFKGKIQYVAPEQYVACPTDRRADIYAAGVILWEAATHRRMWSGLSDLLAARRVAAGHIPLPSAIEPGIPKRLEAICMRALAVNPDDRYATAREFREELQSFLDDLGEPITRESVGALVAEMAAEQRARMDKIIGEQLDRLRQEEASPSLAPTVTSPRTLLKDLLGQEGRVTSSPWVPHSALGFATAGVLLGMLTGLVLVLVSRWSDATGHIVASDRPAGELVAPDPRASSAGMARSVPAGPASTRARLTVETVPSSARVGIDGSLLPLDAHDVVMLNDHAAHRVWAEAPGFQTGAEWVRLEGEKTTIKLILAPIEARPAPREAKPEAPRPAIVAAKRSAGAVPAAAQPPSAAPPQKLEATPKAARARVQLDTSDPWKN